MITVHTSTTQIVNIDRNGGNRTAGGSAVELIKLPSDRDGGPEYKIENSKPVGSTITVPSTMSHPSSRRRGGEISYDRLKSEAETGDNDDDLESAGESMREGSNKSISDEESLDLESSCQPIPYMSPRRNSNTTGRSQTNSHSQHSSAQSSSQKFTSSSSTLHSSQASSQQSLTSGFTPSVFGALVDLQERNAAASDVMTSMPLLGLDDNNSQQNNHDSIRWEDEASHITERTDESESLSKIVEEASDASNSEVRSSKVSSENGTTLSTARTSPETYSGSGNKMEDSKFISDDSSCLNVGIPSTDEDILLAGARMDQSSRRLVKQKNTSVNIRSAPRRPLSPTNDQLLEGARMDQSFKSLTYPSRRTEKTDLESKVDEEYGIVGNVSQDIASQVTSVVRNTRSSPESRLKEKHLEALKKQLREEKGCCGDIIQDEWDVVALVSFILSATLLVVVVVVFEVVGTS